MAQRYVPATTGTAFLGMVPYDGTVGESYVKTSDYDKLQVENDSLKAAIERYMRVSTEQQVEIESMRNLLRSVGFGET